MNYAVVILAFVFLLATSYWFVRGRKYYIGPRSQTHVVNGGVVEDPAPEVILDEEKVVATGAQI